MNSFKASPSKLFIRAAKLLVDENNRYRPMNRIFNVRTYEKFKTLDLVNVDYEYRKQLKTLYMGLRQPTYHLDSLIKEDTYNFYHFIMEFDVLFNKYLKPHIPAKKFVRPEHLRTSNAKTGKLKVGPLTQEELKIEMDNRLHDRALALTARLECFQLKWLTLYGLHEYSPAKKASISQKFKLLDEKMLNTQVMLKIYPLGTLGGESIVSILHTLVKHLNTFENLLKELLLGIASSYLPRPISLPIDDRITKQIKNALNKIAPNKFTGSEGDYYYVCQFLLMEPNELNEIRFNSSQLQQWLDFSEEFTLVFLFYTIPGLNCDFSLLIEKRKTLHLPFYDFITQPFFSNNTFNRFLHATHRTMLQAWLILWIAMIKRGKIIKTAKTSKFNK